MTPRTPPAPDKSPNAEAAGLLAWGGAGLFLIVLLTAYRLIDTFDYHADEDALTSLRNTALPPAEDAVHGLLAGTAAAALLARPFLHRVLPAAVAGGFVGALCGFVDVFLLGQYLNLKDSDNVAAWRENRSWVVIVDAAVIAFVGAELAMLDRVRRRSIRSRGGP